MCVCVCIGLSLVANCSAGEEGETKVSIYFVWMMTRRHKRVGKAGADLHGKTKALGCLPVWCAAVRERFVYHVVIASNV